MGSPKALLEWGNDTLIGYQVRQLAEAGCDEIVVVLGHQADSVHRRIGQLPCRVMLNPRFHSGRSSSLRLGAKAISRDSSVIVVLNVDQPRPASFIRELLDAHNSKAAATRPTFEGKHGHPIVVSGRLRADLMEADDERKGLREILRNHKDQVTDVSADEVCLLDLNTPDDYESARNQAGD